MRDLKKITGTPKSQPKRIRFATVGIFKDKYSVQTLCEYLGVSRQGYYKWVGSGKPIHVKHNPILAYLVKETFDRRPKGYRYVAMQLKRKYGVIVNEKTAYRYMRILGLKSAARKRHHPKSYYSEARAQTRIISPNVLNRDFTAKHPLEKLVTDVSYIYHKNGKLYLSVIKDLYDNSILSYRISAVNDNDLVFKTVEAAGRRRHNSKTILHSDQGLQYTHPDYLAKCAKHHFIPSNSRKGNCLDNACCENFFGHLKAECLYLEKPMSAKALIKQVGKYIAFYNQDRPQTKLKGMTPFEYRKSRLQLLN